MIPTATVIDLIRSQKHRYIRSPTRLGEELSSRLVFDALVAGAGRVLVERNDRWWIVGSPFDWLAGAAGSLDELFRGIISTPHVGDNTHRHEVVVAAFADAVAVYRSATREWHQGAIRDLTPVDSFVKGHMAGWRAVAFAVLGETGIAAESDSAGKGL
jgi:hypothetical protein